MIIGGILAGGLGTRMSGGDGLPKQFLTVGGIPVIVRTLKRFLEQKEIDAVIVAMNKDWIDYCKELLLKYGITQDKARIVEGGSTRFESLLCLANACIEYSKEKNNTDEIIMINHDCARPFVSSRILKDNIEKLREYDMVTTSVPTIDTVLISKDGKCSDSVPDRPTVFCDQGPQTFHVDRFLELSDSLDEKEKGKYMEAGRLYLAKGLKVGIVEGERENFKLTTQFDLQLAEFMLQNGKLQ